MEFLWYAPKRGLPKRGRGYRQDLSTALLAREIHADILVITTGVEKVCIHFGKPQQQALDRVDIATMTRYMQEGHFPPGSMLPKIIASLTFPNRAAKK